MPYRPKRPCPVCRRLVCDDERHRPRSEPWTKDKPDIKERRPRYGTRREQQRRRRTVQNWLAANGVPMGDGKLAAICPECGHWRTAFVADHLTPVLDGGDEGGPLGVHCRSCSNSQGARLANKLRMRRRS